MKVAGISIVTNVVFAIALVALYSNYNSLDRANEMCKTQRGTLDLQTSNLQTALTRSLADKYAARHCVGNAGILSDAQLDRCLENAVEEAWEDAHKVANRTE